MFVRSFRINRKETVSPMRMACVSILISESLLRFSIVIAGIMLAQAAGFAVAGDNPKTKTPTCVRCGATCGLREICVCESSTKKKPKTEYTVTCDPICVPRWSGFSWPFARCLHGGGCTDCQPDPCRAWVRYRKKLIPETKDEDVAVIERRVESICVSCAGCGKPGCCSSDPAEAVDTQAAAGDGAGMIRERSAQAAPSAPNQLPLER
jgi:hypothetical protein